MYLTKYYICFALAIKSIAIEMYMYVTQTILLMCYINMDF